MPTRCKRWYLLQNLLLAQHVSGTSMPIIRSSRVLDTWLLPVWFLLQILLLAQHVSGHHYAHHQELESITHVFTACVIFIADLIACSTCFGHHYAHNQELESIVQVVTACGTWCFGFQVVGMVWSWRLCVWFAITLSSTPYRQLENQSTKYHRQQPPV